MATKSISQLDSASSVSASDLYEVAVPDAQSVSGYASKKESGAQIATFFHEQLQNNNLNTTAKTIVGAINEVDSEGVKWSEQNILGAKNLIPFDTYNPSGYEQNGITFTVNENGFVIANGTKTTASYNSTFNLSERRENTGLFLQNGTYILTGCPSGGGTTTYEIGVAYMNSDNVYTNYGFDDGDGLEFTVNGSYYSASGAWVRIFCVLRGGTASADNLTFRPMIRLNSIKNSEYTPPSKTNRKLMLEAKNLLNNIATNETSENASKSYAIGDYMFYKDKFYKVTSAITKGGAITIDTNISETTIGAELKAALTT